MPRNKNHANVCLKLPVSPDSAVARIKRWKKSRRSNDVIPQEPTGWIGNCRRRCEDLFKFLSADEERLFIATPSKPVIWWKHWCNVLLQVSEWTIEKQLLLRPVRISAKAELWLVANKDDVVEDLRNALAVAPPVSAVKPASRPTLPIDLSTGSLPVPDAVNIQISNVKQRKYKSFSSFSVNMPSISEPLTVASLLIVLKRIVKKQVNRPTSGLLHHVDSDSSAAQNWLDCGDPNSNSNTQEDSELESIRCQLSLSIEQFNVYVSHSLFGFSFQAISQEENCSVQVVTQYLADCVLSGLPLHMLALEISQEMISDAHTALRWADWLFILADFERFVLLMSTLPFRPAISAENVKIMVNIMRYEYGLKTGVRTVNPQTERHVEVISLLDSEDNGNDQLEEQNQHNGHNKQVCLPRVRPLQPAQGLISAFGQIFLRQRIKSELSTVSQ
uniref:Uncharacterized protein n=1 Tax=Ditylenchus dipsaci TaxID=166011 RepID=A0A915DJA0_9BILA